MDERDENAEGAGGAEIPQGLIYILADMIIAAVARGPLDAEQIRLSEERLAAVRARFPAPALVVRSETDDLG
ncbi:MAG: hypothetical protein HY874_07335 [Chloroflexi bacterium]|nr:hypothetical protein [Chloroflexota bacterium]